MSAKRLRHSGKEEVKERYHVVKMYFAKRQLVASFYLPLKIFLERIEKSQTEVEIFL